MKLANFFRAALVIGTLFAGLTQSAQASIYTYTGDTTGGPTYNRPLEDLSDVSGIGTDVNYSTFTFTVDTSGEYSFLQTTDQYDGVLYIYENSFNPADPLTNALGGSDDLVAPWTSGFAGPLDAGISYVLVTTSFYNGDAGAFSVTISGPGLVTVSAVPEPSTYLMLALGLAAIGYTQRRKLQR
ncbi:PEP-CTERM sorting domain-containing protein [Pseudoduganella buxea]|nr:PEP-CTERM sorting domain-containing protein [Pseudoduganella buxea]GGC03541.1 hypothetical protein GCM10011572_26930 [Pseudoduganella buxea]